MVQLSSTGSLTREELCGLHCAAALHVGTPVSSMMGFGVYV